MQAQAQTSCSADYPRPQISLFSSYGRLTYDTSKSVADITGLAAKQGAVERGIFASGLSTLSVDLEISVKTTGSLIGEEGFCIYPENINITVAFRDPVIYIANNLAAQTCLYNVVRRHEQTHQQINKKALDYFLPLFYEAADYIADDMRPVLVANISDIDSASENFTQEFNRKFSPLFEFFKQQLLAEQHKLDNAVNYQFESSLCR